jgi:ribosomal protein S18 acetylase RimI-like enzyme
VKNKTGKDVSMIAYQKYTGRYDVYLDSNLETHTTAELSDIYVDQSLWGQGVAQTLAQGTEAELQKMGYKTIVLRTNNHHERAQAFYQKMGFQRQHGLQIKPNGENFSFFVKKLG